MLSIFINFNPHHCSRLNNLSINTFTTTVIYVVQTLLLGFGLITICFDYFYQQDIEKSKDFNTYFVKLSHGVHWVDIPEGEERISFGFLRTQSAKEFLLQYKGRLAFKLQVRLMTEEFESAISSAKHIVPGKIFGICYYCILLLLC